MFYSRDYLSVDVVCQLTSQVFYVVVIGNPNDVVIVSVAVGGAS